MSSIVASSLIGLFGRVRYRAFSSTVFPWKEMLDTEVLFVTWKLMLWSVKALKRTEEKVRDIHLVKLF